MFFPSIFILFNFLRITFAIPTEASYPVDDGMASPKPSINTATESDTNLAASSTSLMTSSSTVTSTTTITSTVRTAKPETITRTMTTPTSTSEPPGVWVPNTSSALSPSSTSSSCTDNPQPHTFTTLTKSKHPSHHSQSPHPTFCTLTPSHYGPLPIATSYPYNLASRYICISPLLRRLLSRSCTIPTDPPPSGPDAYPSNTISPCIPPPFGTGYEMTPSPSPTSTSSTKTNTTPDFKTMVETEMSTNTATTMTQTPDYASLVAGGYPTLPSGVNSTPVQTQVPVETFKAVPEEDVPGEGGGEMGMGPACGMNRGEKPCPSVE
ncbi:hypothetical protein BKA65DRAFT_33990 [Rhexocercosporidium sp. MPI-PUGE-AT-0058]|nr:hypothetical protein BKA65DRAFT_33990 [Rhexocercosporidium sp. MPI-PUGE-AT-0058]